MGNTKHDDDGSASQRPQLLLEARKLQALTRLLKAVEGHAVFLLDADGRVSAWHACAERVLGYTEREALGLSHLCLYGQLDAEAGTPQRFLEGAAREGQARENLTCLRKDGSTFPAIASIVALKDELGRTWAFGCTLRDLTESRRRSEPFISVFEHAVHGIAVIDAEGTILLFNPEAERLFGQPASAVVGRNVRMLMPEPDSQLHDGYLERYLRTGEARVLGIGRDVTALRGDGSTFPAHLDVAQFMHDGRRAFIGVVRDLTASQRLEGKLRHAQRLEALGQFAGGIAHDFNNLLTIILGCADLALATMTPGDRPRGLLEDIRSAGARATQLTRDLLAFGGLQEVTTVVTDVNTVLLGVEPMLRRLIREDIQLIVLPAAIGGHVRVHPGQMEQVIVNLVLNARDAMPTGGRVTLETSVVDALDASWPPGDASGPQVRLSISDTGGGMTPEVQSHLFEPFFTTKGPGKGTGLGLATTYGIVKQSGGSISVQSRPGMGATFQVLLPLANESIQEAPPRVASNAVPRGSECILLVEDDDGVRALAQLVLQECGYEVLAAADGAAALGISDDRTRHIDLLVCDVVMPGLTGREVAALFDAGRPGIPTLYVSGHADDVVLGRGIERGDVTFLQKPFSPGELARAVRSALDHAR